MSEHLNGDDDLCDSFYGTGNGCEYKRDTFEPMIHQSEVDTRRERVYKSLRF